MSETPLTLHLQQAFGERQPWSAPQLVRMILQDAENASGILDDGNFLLS